MKTDQELLRAEFHQVDSKFRAIKKATEPLRDEYNRLAATLPRGSSKTKAQANKIKKAEAEIPALAARRSEITRQLGRNSQGVTKVGAPV